MAQFWKDVEARQADFKELLKVVPALTAEQQVAAVAARLKEHNPGFDGQVAKQDRGRRGDGARDRGQRDRPFAGAGPGGTEGPQLSEGPLSDLSPLKGMKLATLNLDQHSVQDLSPLKGMPLTSLVLA